MSKKKNRVSVLLVVLLFLFSSVVSQPAFCDDAAPEKLTTYLKKGEKAPFEGILLSIPLAAEIKNNCSPDVIQKRCDASVKEAISLCKSAAQKDVDVLKETLKAQEEKFQKILQAKDEEIVVLRDHLKPAVWYEKPVLWLAVGVVLGGGTAIYLMK